MGFDSSDVFFYFSPSHPFYSFLYSVIILVPNVPDKILLRTKILLLKLIGSDFCCGMNTHCTQQPLCQPVTKGLAVPFREEGLILAHGLRELPSIMMRRHHSVAPSIAEEEYGGPLFIRQWTMKQRVARTRGWTGILSRLNIWDLIFPTRPHLLKILMSPTTALVARKQAFKSKSMDTLSYPSHDNYFVHIALKTVQTEWLNQCRFSSGDLSLASRSKPDCFFLKSLRRLHHTSPQLPTIFWYSSLQLFLPSSSCTILPIYMSLSKLSPFPYFCSRPFLDRVLGCSPGLPESYFRMALNIQQSHCLSFSNAELSEIKLSCLTQIPPLFVRILKVYINRLGSTLVNSS